MPVRFNAPGSRPKRKDKSEKSKVYRFRLHPEIIDENWAMQVTERYEREQGIGIRKLYVRGLKALENLPIEPPPDHIYAAELQRVGDLLDEVLSRIENVETVAPRRSKSKGERLQLPKAARDTLQKFLDEGVYSDDE